MKVDVLFCLSLQEMTTSLLDGILQERSYREVLDGFVRLLMNTVVLVNPGGIHTLAGYC